MFDHPAGRSAKASAATCTSLADVSSAGVAAETDRGAGAGEDGDPGERSGAQAHRKAGTAGFGRHRLGLKDRGYAREPGSQRGTDRGDSEAADA